MSKNICRIGVGNFNLTRTFSFSQCRQDSTESTESDVLHELKNNNNSDDEELDTDLETDRLLGHQRSDDTGFYDEKTWLNNKHNRNSSLLSKLSPKLSLPQQQQPQQQVANGQSNTTMINTTTNKPPPLLGNSLLRQGLGSLITSPVPDRSPKLSTTNLMDISESISSPEHSDKDNNSNSNVIKSPQDPGSEESPGSTASNTENEKKKKTKSKEVLIEGVLFRAKYLGSTQLVCEGQPTKSTRMMQAEEAVSRIKVNIVVSIATKSNSSFTLSLMNLLFLYTRHTIIIPQSLIQALVRR